MGDTIWVDVRGLSRDEVPGGDNSIMLRLMNQLDRLAGKLKVSKLSVFCDDSELEVEYGDIEEAGDLSEESEPADEEQASGSWFDSGQALTAVRAIYNHLKEHPEDLGFKPDRSRSHWPGRLMDELENCQAALEKAVARGQPFRFLIVP